MFRPPRMDALRDDEAWHVVPGEVPAGRAGGSFIAICVIAAISQAQRYRRLRRTRRIVAEARARGGVLLPLFPPEREES